MAFFTNEDYNKIAQWLEANAKKDTSLDATDTVNPKEDIVAIVRTINGIPNNYKIKIKDFLNAGLHNNPIWDIMVEHIKVTNDLVIRAEDIILGSVYGETLQDVFDYFDNNLTLKEIDIPDTAGDTVRNAYALVNNNNEIKGTPIYIYKDSALQLVYIGSTNDTCNEDTGEPIKYEIQDNAALCFIYHLANGKYTLASIPTESFFNRASYDSSRGLGMEDNKLYVKLSNDEETLKYLTFDSLSGGIKIIGLKNKVSITDTFTARTPSYDTDYGNTQYYKAVLTIKSNTSVVFNVTTTTYGNPNMNTIWLSSLASVSFTSLKATDLLVKAAPNGDCTLFIPCASSSRTPIKTYDFQIIQCSETLDNLGIYGDSGVIAPYSNLIEPIVIKYSEPFNETNAKTFYIQSNKSSVHLTDVNDFIGKVNDNSTSAEITVHNEEEERTYRFTFDSNLDEVSFKTYNGTTLCTIENVYAGDVYTLTSISNEEGGWLVNKQRADITSDGSVIIRYIDGVPQLSVPTNISLVNSYKTLQDNRGFANNITVGTHTIKQGDTVIAQHNTSRYYRGNASHDLTYEQFASYYDMLFKNVLPSGSLDSNLVDFIARFYSYNTPTATLAASAWSNTLQDMNYIMQYGLIIFSEDMDITLPVSNAFLDGHSVYFIGNKSLKVNGKILPSNQPIKCLYNKREWYISSSTTDTSVTITTNKVTLPIDVDEIILDIEAITPIVYLPTKGIHNKKIKIVSINSGWSLEREGVFIYLLNAATNVFISNKDTIMEIMWNDNIEGWVYNMYYKVKPLNS